MKSSFLIVADRGNLKAFQVEKVPDRRPRLRLVQSLTLTDAHTRLSETLTDQAGRFPTGDASHGAPVGGTGRHQNSVAEKGQLVIETDKRIIKQLAGHIADVLNQETPGAWSLAAPAAIHQAVLDQLDPALRRQLAESVAADLVNTDQSELLDHFSAVRGA